MLDDKLRDNEKIIEGVRKIKGDKFSLDKIKETITVLERNGYFN